MEQNEGKVIGLMMDVSQYQTMMMKKLVQNPFGLGLFLNSEPGKEFSKDVNFEFFTRDIFEMNFQ